MSIKEQASAEPPALLFKYAGDWVEGFFKDPNPYLRFSSPNNFNDPYDFFPTIKLKLNRKKREEHCRHFKLPINLSARELAIQIAEISRLEIGRKYAVNCMSELPDNIRMWGHYAQKHEGCVLAFDSDLIRGFRYEKSPYFAGKVCYVSQKCVIPYPMENISEENYNIVFPKAKEWEYENEWRIAIRRKSMSEDKYLDLNFRADCLRWVIIGCRATEVKKAKNYVDALKANEKFKHVSVFYAEKDFYDYRMIIRSESGEKINWQEKMREYSEEKMRSPKDPWYKNAAEKRRLKYGV